MRARPLFLVPAAAVLVLAGCAHTRPVTSIPASLGAARPVATPHAVAARAGGRTAGAARAQAPGALYFDFDSSLLRDQSRKELQKTGQLLEHRPSTSLEIDGNCDERGTEAYNLALGEHRALAAKRYLQRLGVAPDRLKTLSYGKDHPKYFGHDEAAWARNRRDDLVVEAR